MTSGFRIQLAKALSKSRVGRYEFGRRKSTDRFGHRGGLFAGFLGRVVHVFPAAPGWGKRFIGANDVPHPSMIRLWLIAALADVVRLIRKYDSRHESK